MSSQQLEQVDLRKRVENAAKEGFYDAGMDVRGLPDMSIDRIVTIIEQEVTKALNKERATIEVEVIDPAIDEMFGTIDYKLVADNILSYIESKTSHKEER